ncbi:MAG: MATE family efflux transporter [Halobacteriales archaeon]
MTRPRYRNPLRTSLLLIGHALASLGVIDRDRATRTTDLAWPRVVTGIARMSKTAADVAMVGLAIGPVAITGLAFAGPYWGMAFALGGGIAGGTISLVSQRYGARAWYELDLSIKSSAVVTLAVTLPVAAGFALTADSLVAFLGAEGDALRYGSRYLSVVSLGVPFAALNLIGSRALVGADDAWTPMMVRAGGAVINIGLNAVLIFGLGLGVVGAALGTVLSNVAVLAAFTGGFLGWRLPYVGTFPVTVQPSRPLVDRDLVRDLVEIATPLVFTNGSRTAAQFPLLAILATFGDPVVAAYEIAKRVRGLLNTPGWGFSLASSSLVGQSLGVGDEDEAGDYGREIIVFAVAVYAIGAVLAFVLAAPITRAFVDDPANLPIAEPFVRVAALSVVFWGVSGAATGPLRASGDTRWPFYANLLGLYAFAIPLTYLGSVTALGLWGVYLALAAETIVPAAVIYHRFATGRWKAISRRYRPEAAIGDD